MNNWIINHFKNQNVFIIGGGPSLVGFDFNRLKNKNTIVINHAFEYVPNLDILIFLDNVFRAEFLNRGFKFEDFDFKVIAGPSSGMKPNDQISVIQLVKEVSTDPKAMYGRATSTLVALNTALISGAKNIYLLGIDQKFRAGQDHFYSDDWSKKGLTHRRANNQSCYVKMIHEFKKYVKYQNIFNCSTMSLLDYFPKTNIDEALDG